MDILNRITKLLKEQKKTQKELCEDLGLKQQAYTNWKNNNNDSYKKYLPEIAEYLGVSVDCLLGKTNQAEKQENSVELSHHEKELVYAYRSQPELQTAVDKLLGISTREHTV